LIFSVTVYQHIEKALYMAVPYPSHRELFHACRILFGPAVHVSPEFLRYLQPIGLKTAFRKRALETHPDRAKALGSPARDLHSQFRTVKQAYELLSAFLKTKNRRLVSTVTFTSYKPAPPASPRTSGQRMRQQHARQHQKTGRKTSADHFYRGGLPQRNLLFGQFLYYAGIISWRTLINAIAWQRMQRPKIGQIAIAWGMLTPRDVIRILTERTLNEKFGECALRIGYITNFQHIALIGRQRKLQRQLGEYFVRTGQVSGGEILHLVNRQRMHNRGALRRK
jgi:hypothetical protein